MEGGSERGAGTSRYKWGVSRFHYRCPMRWGDLDAQGHVNNAVLLEYLQEARVEFLLTGREVMHQLLATGVLVASHQVEYLAPIGFDGSPVELELWVESVGGSRFELGYEISHAHRLTGRARTVGVAYDLTRGSLRRLLPEERAEFAARLERGEPLRALPRVPVGPHPHRFPIRVRWSDLDSYGHVNNVKFYDYVQEARLALMGEALGFPSEGEVWVIARQDLEYARPLDFRLAAVRGPHRGGERRHPLDHAEHRAGRRRHRYRLCDGPDRPGQPHAGGRRPA